MTLEELAAKFEGAHQTASGYDVKCPAHEDDHASCSIGNGDREGFLVVKCHAGCKTRDILEAVGLKFSDIMPRSESPRGQRRVGLGREVCAYSYRNAGGSEAYQVVRFDPKTFRQRRAARPGEESRNGWVWNLRGVDLLLYRLPEVLVAATQRQNIFVVEGEKDADNLSDLGVCATSSPGGAQKRWLPSYTESLRGAKQVVIIPDNDEPGRQHARKVATALSAARIPHMVLALPGPGKDASDWISTGGTLAKLAELLAAAPGPVMPEIRVAAPGDRPGPKPLRLGKNLESAIDLFRDAEARAAALWPGTLGFNLMTGCVEIADRSVEDYHVTQVRERVARRYQLPGGGLPLHFTAEQVRDAIDQVAHENEFHPVEAWLRSLPSVGVGHIERIARDCLGLKTPHEVATVRRWFLSAAARPLRPGCQADSALVLFGPQAVKKTTFFRTLAGPWYGSGPIKPNDKDCLMKVHRSWIYEWAELAAIHLRTIEEVRDFMTNPIDRWVPKYGRSVVVRPRRSVFGASTNKKDFLNDPAGNRRFWPVQIMGQIDIAVVEELREAAFAEARDAVLEHNERWWLDWDGEQAQAEHAEEFRERDIWHEDIESWLVDQWSKTGQYNAFTTREIATGAVGAARDKLTDKEAKRVSTVMTMLNWTQIRAQFDGLTMRLWVPSDVANKDMREQWHRPPADG